jgi:hypothetical protein
MTTIDLIDDFCRQSIIGIVDVLLTIGAQLWQLDHDNHDGQDSQEIETT